MWPRRTFFVFCDRMTCLMLVIRSDLELRPVLIEKHQCFTSNRITNLSSRIRRELEMYLHAGIYR